MSSMDILYRKRNWNCADVLSRRPGLTYLLSPYEDNDIDSEIESLFSFLNSMFHLQVDSELLQSITNAYLLDPAFCRSTLPAAATKALDGLYYMADKIHIPNDPMMYHRLISDFHDSSGHPGYLCTLDNLFSAMLSEKVQTVLYYSLFYHPQNIRSGLWTGITWQITMPSCMSHFGTKMLLSMWKWHW